MAVAGIDCVNERKGLSGKERYAACRKAERNCEKPYDKMRQSDGSD